MPTDEQIRPQDDFAFFMDGYLAAIARLKDDGSHFSFVSLPIRPVETGKENVCDKLGLDPANCELDVLPCERTLVPDALRTWLTARMRDDDNDSSGLLAVTEGFIEELVDHLGGRLKWRSLKRTGSHAPACHLGALWDVFILTVEEQNFMIHCSWDS